MKEQRQWKEASAAEARRASDLEAQLAAERTGRDAAEAQLATLQVRQGVGREAGHDVPSAGCMGSDGSRRLPCITRLPAAPAPKDKVQQLEAELAAARDELAAAVQQREEALAAESAALQRQEAAAAAQAEAEARCLQHAEERERAEQEAAKARVDAQRCVERLLPPAFQRAAGEVHQARPPLPAAHCRCPRLAPACSAAAARRMPPAASLWSWRSGRRR